MTESTYRGVYGLLFGFFIGIGGCSQAATANSEATNPDAGPGVASGNDAKGTADPEAAAAAFQTLCRNVKRLNEILPKIDPKGLVAMTLGVSTDSTGAETPPKMTAQPITGSELDAFRMAAVVTCDEETKTVRSTTMFKQDAASSSTPSTAQPARKEVSEWKINAENKISIHTTGTKGGIERKRLGEFDGNGDTSFVIRVFDEEPTLVADELIDFNSSFLKLFDPTIPTSYASCSVPFEKIRMAKTARSFLASSRLNTRRFDKRKAGDLYGYKEENQDQFFYLFDGNEKVSCLSQPAVQYRN